MMMDSDPVLTSNMWRWGMNYEIENIPWDEFGTSDDHIVPHQRVEQVNEFVTPHDAHKKPRHVEDLGKSVYSKGPDIKTVLQNIEDTYFHTPMSDGNCTILEVSQYDSSENVVPKSHNHNFITSESVLTSLDAKLSDQCFSDCKVDADSSILCSNNPIPAGRVPIDDSRSSYLSLDEVIPAPVNLDYWESENKDKENDLVYYGLPDIGNFEDIDRMLRNSDTTFEEGLTGTTDDLSWFSAAPNTICGSEVTFESGLQSSCPKLSSLNGTSGHHLVDTNFWCKSDQSTTNCDKPSSLCYQPENADDYAHSKQVNSRTSFVTQINVNVLDGHQSPDMIGVHLNKRESQQYSLRKNEVQHYPDHKFLPSAVSTRACSAYHSSKKKDILGAASSSLPISNHYAQMEYFHHQVPFPQTPNVKFECESGPSSSYNISDNVINHPTQCMESHSDQMCKLPVLTQQKLQKLQKQQLGATMIAEHLQNQAAFTNKAATQKHHGYCYEIGTDSTVPNISLLPTLEVDYSSIAQESSFSTPVCPDAISVEATSFQQLQVVMEQLDIRTKMCIRDSLYRLARSAKQRHDFTDTNDCSRVSKVARGSQCTEARNKCSEFVDVETDTNPIDRSIANLLFAGLPEPATGSI